MQINYIKNKEIDFEKYDKCISKSAAGTVYAMSWYLDIVSPQWSILMAEDYSYVIPLPEKRKYGIRYVIQPYFCQQLGVFSKNKLSEEIFTRFLKTIPHRYANLQLNTSNAFNLPQEKLRPNYVLKLTDSFEEITSRFGSNCKRNIKKAQSYDNKICEITPEKYIDFLIKNDKGIINETMVKTLGMLIDKALDSSSGRILANFSENNLTAAVFLVSTSKRIYYLTPVSSEEGKQKQSMALLVSEVISQNANFDLILDFEGSSIPGVAKFYAGFGADLEYYPIWKQIKLF